MGFLNEKSLDQMVEEEERTEAKKNIARGRAEVAEQEALLEKAKKMGQDWKMYSNNGIKSGIDWESMKFKLGNPTRITSEKGY